MSMSDASSTVTSVRIFENATFTGLTVTGDGAAISVKKPGTATVIDCLFENNLATKNGGAIACAVESAIIITGSTFTHNIGKLTGGAILNSSGKMGITDSIFSANTAATGGAIYANYGTNDLSGVEFSANSATSGGAIYCAQVKPATFDSCVFQSNTAFRYGGAIYNSQGELTLDACTFSKNKARLTGGAIQNDDTMSILGGIFISNSGMLGGAIYNSGKITVESSYFAKGTGQYGGAIQNAGSTATIRGCTFTDNVMLSDGGALYNESSSMFVYDSVFSANTAGVGAAIANSSAGSLYVSGCTFTANEASTSGGAIYSASGSSLNLSDCVFATESDTVVFGAGTMCISGNIYSSSSIKIIGKSELHFQNDASITVDGLLNLSSSTKVFFDTGAQVKFLDAQDFSSTTLNVTVSWDDADFFTIATGDIKLAAIPTIKVNGVGMVVGTPLKNGDYYYKVEYIENSDADRLIVRRYTQSIDASTYTLADAFAAGTSSVAGFDVSTDGTPITKAALGTNNLQAATDKSICGNGSEKTIINVNMFGNAHDLTLSNMSCTGFVFGGANGTQLESSTQSVTMKGDISASKVFGGARIASEQYGTEETRWESSLILADDVNGSFDILSGGNLVSAAASDFADTSVSIQSEDANVSIGFVIAGSIVNKDVDYSVTGNSDLAISAGTYDWLIGSGFVEGDGSYTQDGDITINLSGGSVHVLFGGISSEQAAKGTKTINGDINITVDSSKNKVELYTLFAGNNGANSMIDGNVFVTFTGKGDNLTFSDGKNGIVGDSATELKTVQGVRTFTFDAFEGVFGARAIKKFDVMQVISGSQVDLSVYDLSGVTSWCFDADSSMNWTDGHNNDFTGDTLTFGSLEDTLADEGTVFFSSNYEYCLNGWQDFESVTLLGQDATFSEETDTWISADYKMTCVEYNIISGDSSTTEYCLEVSRLA